MRAVSKEIPQPLTTKISLKITHLKFPFNLPGANELRVNDVYWLDWWQQAVTWINVDLSSVRSSDIHLWASLQEIPQSSITEIIWKFKYLKFHSNFPGDSELINSLWPSDTIWRQRSGSTLAQVMACCPTAPSHYLQEPMLTYHKYGPVTLIWGQFHKRYLSHWPLKSVWKLLI